MPLIDNKNQTLQDALKNALTTADSVDIAVGFFYFSGFQALFDQLKDKLYVCTFGKGSDRKGHHVVSRRITTLETTEVSDASTHYMFG